MVGISQNGQDALLARARLLVRASGGQRPAPPGCKRRPYESVAVVSRSSAALFLASQTCKRRASSDLAQVPAAAVLAAEIPVCFPAVRDPESKRVPLDAVAHAQGDVAELVRFGERTRVAEVAARLSARLDGRPPSPCALPRGPSLAGAAVRRGQSSALRTVRGPRAGCPWCRSRPDRRRCWRAVVCRRRTSRVLSGGWTPRAAHSNRMTLQSGYISRFMPLVSTTSTAEGAPRSSAQNITFRPCGAISPSAPLPNSVQPRHTNGW